MPKYNIIIVLMPEEFTQRAAVEMIYTAAFDIPA